jgi:predicted ribosomally synthesized peptide with SipW-like signal peptide
MPAHVAAHAPLSRFHVTVRATLVASAAFVAAIVIALAAAGGTFAYFSSATPISAGTVTAGSTGLTIQNVASYPITGLDTTALLPGVSVFTSTPLTVANTGTSSVSVTQGAASFGAVKAINGYLVITVGRVSNGTTSCTAGAGTALGSGYTLAPLATMKVCVTVTLSMSSPGTVAGQTTSFTIPLDGVQVGP